jgi:hypothetical protein
MKYVLDNGVAFKWVVQENGTPTALRLRESFRNSIHELIAPNCFPLEVGNALTKAERQKIINPPDGWAAWLTVMADCPALAQPPRSCRGHTPFPLNTARPFLTACTSPLQSGNNANLSRLTKGS